MDKYRHVLVSFLMYLVFNHKISTMAYLFALLLSLPALTLCQPGDLNAVAVASFNKLDIDGDGNVERPELDTFFKAEDTNNDGRVSRHEYTVAVEAQYGHDPQLIHALHNLFDSLDFNNDNHLDKPDYDRLFTTADTSGNSLVNENEFVKFFKDSVQQNVVG